MYNFLLNFRPQNFTELANKIGKIDKSCHLHML